MTQNSFGHLLKFTSFGESHGAMIGCVLDGVPPRIPLCEEDIQTFLDRRKPGQSRHTTQRREDDKVKIISGVFEGLTTGAPIALLIENNDARSKDYSDIKDIYRPAHADYTYDQKYGIRDYRGGGRSSARETALRVAAGAIADKILKIKCNPAINIFAHVCQIGTRAVNTHQLDFSQIGSNPFFAADPEIVELWEQDLDDARKAGDSLGAIVEVVAQNIPAGLGAPLYSKLDADLAGAMMGINAVKGVEIGAGFHAATLKGSQNADQMRAQDGAVHFLSNHAGGILGGISTGQDIIVRLAFKPTSSILTPLQTINNKHENCDISTKGRHDPCVGIRGAPVASAMMALVLCDHYLWHKAIS
jgi:chorismate synthase